MLRLNRLLHLYQLPLHGIQKIIHSYKKTTSLKEKQKWLYFPHSYKHVTPKVFTLFHVSTPGLFVLGAFWPTFSQIIWESHGYEPSPLIYCAGHQISQIRRKLVETHVFNSWFFGSSLIFVVWALLLIVPVLVIDYPDSLAYTWFVTMLK